jgi:hypothetical protein
MTPALLLAGLGFGLMLAPTNAVVVAAAGPADAATGASLLQLARLLGMTFGSAALTAYGLERFSTLVADLSLTNMPAYLAGVRAGAHQVFVELFGWGAALSLAAAVAVVGMGPGRAARADHRP